MNQDSELTNIQQNIVEILRQKLSEYQLAIFFYSELMKNEEKRIKKEDLMSFFDLKIIEKILKGYFFLDDVLIYFEEKQERDVENLIIDELIQNKECEYQISLQARNSYKQFNFKIFEQKLFDELQQQKIDQVLQQLIRKIKFFDRYLIIHKFQSQIKMGLLDNFDILALKSINNKDCITKLYEGLIKNIADVIHYQQNLLNEFINYHLIKDKELLNIDVKKFKQLEILQHFILETTLPQTIKMEDFYKKIESFDLAQQSNQCIDFIEKEIKELKSFKEKNNQNNNQDKNGCQEKRKRKKLQLNTNIQQIQQEEEKYLSVKYLFSNDEEIDQLLNKSTKIELQLLKLVYCDSEVNYLEIEPENFLNQLVIPIQIAKLIFRLNDLSNAQITKLNCVDILFQIIDIVLKVDIQINSYHKNLLDHQQQKMINSTINYFIHIIIQEFRLINFQIDLEYQIQILESTLENIQSQINNMKNELKTFEIAFGQADQILQPNKVLDLSQQLLQEQSISQIIDIEELTKIIVFNVYTQVQKHNLDIDQQRSLWNSYYHEFEKTLEKPLEEYTKQQIYERLLENFKTKLNTNQNQQLNSV